MAHKFSEPYSGKNPIPKITTGIRSLVNPQKATEAKAQEMQSAGNRTDEGQTQGRTGKMEHGRAVRVRDPTTGEEIDIRNADEGQHNQVGQNVLKLELPEPADWNEHRDVVLSTSTQSVYALAATYALSLLLLFIRVPLIPTALRLFSALLLPVIVTSILIKRLRRTAVNDADARAWHSERIRGLRAGSDMDQDGTVSTEERIRESAEWANTLLRGVWPILNPSLFDSLIDMVEDIMQGSVPSFIHSVRISDLGLGSAPLRITSIRALPDSDNEDALNLLDTEDRDQLGGDHVNLEVSFAYRAQPSGSSTESKARNVHLVIDFFLGLKELWGFKTPVWVEVQGVVGTARVRMQLIPDPPFVKTTLLTLLGLPRITISVTALSRALPNVMNIPFVSGFVSSALDTAAAEYVAPKSLILDVQRLLGGSDIKKDTDALGVLVVHIHRAVNIKKMDTTGSSADPYVTLTYSRLGRPLFSTRIVKGDLNPVYEETAVVLVDVNVVKTQERLSIQLWDSDRGSADDMLGFVEVNIIDLMREKNEARRRIANLASPDNSQRPGSVEFTIGYYSKLPPNSSLKTEGHDPGIPEDLRQSSDFKEKRDTALNDLEAAVLVCPPDTAWVSGIVGVQVHEIRELGVGRGGRLGERASGIGDKLKERVGLVAEGEKGDEAGEEEQASSLPSSYCTISLNDELVYQTRVKPITSSPIFNAGTENFIRDWRTTHVDVAVKDSRMRENDAVLGIVHVKLSDILVNASQLTRVYHLEHGVGHGRIRLSILFRPVAAKLPPNLRGFDTGTLRLHGTRMTIEDESVRRSFTKCELRMKTTTLATEEKITHRDMRLDGLDVTWSPERAVELPVRQRYSSALVLALQSHYGSGKRAMAVFWLRDIVDRDRTTVELPLWTEDDSDYSRLRQNYVPPGRHGDLSVWDSDREKLRQVGTVRVDVELIPGISDEHHKMLAETDGKSRTRWEEYERVKMEGGRRSVGQVQVAPPQVKEITESRSDSEPGASKRDNSATRTLDTTNATDGHDGDPPDGEEPNTEVPHDDAEEDSDATGTQDDYASDGGSDGDVEGTDKKSGGPLKKLKKWKQNQRELGLEHRGVMQAKPVRTAMWMTDNVKQGVHSVKERFSMDARQPDVETEV
ncbi:hypothetical protein BC834DRAFT_822647 [Gloeopeniophorella convolvens]|nr:hypothetical protein BC834DRAFT_822647 [Gloeopeniophorella convolvens]